MKTATGTVLGAKSHTKLDKIDSAQPTRGKCNILALINLTNHAGHLVREVYCCQYFALRVLPAALVFGNLPFWLCKGHTVLGVTMPYLSSPQPQRRAERARFSESIPAVLRFADGQRTSGKLRVVSVTGGLLSLQQPLRQGSVAKLMFLTSAGSVLGSAELLSPLSWELQPFKFIALKQDDHSRLHAAIQFCLEQSKRDTAQDRRDRGKVENFRAW